MEPARQPAHRDRLREAVRSRYGSLAGAAQADRAAAGCIAGAPFVATNRAGLTRAGFASVSVTVTRPAGMVSPPRSSAPPGRD